MFFTAESQGSAAPLVHTFEPELPDLRRWVEGFLVARRAAGVTKSMLEFHRKRLEKFEAFCAAQGAASIDHVDATLIRQWLLALEDHGHNPGGSAWRGNPWPLSGRS